MAKKYYLKDILKFGKFKNQSIEYVTESEPSYLKWCVENVEYFVLSDEVMKCLGWSEDMIKMNDDKYQKINYEEFCREEEERTYRENLRDSWFAMTEGDYGDYPGYDVDYEQFGY